MTNLNALVGRKIGLEPDVKWHGSDNNGRSFTVPESCIVGLKHPALTWERREIWPDFCNDIAAAWLLVEWMREQGYYFNCEWRPGQQFWCGFRSTQSAILEDSVNHKNPATAIRNAFCAANGMIEVEQEVRS